MHKTDFQWENSSLSDWSACPRAVMGPSPVCVVAMDRSSQGDKSLIADFWKNMFQSQFWKLICSSGHQGWAFLRSCINFGTGISTKTTLFSHSLNTIKEFGSSCCPAIPLRENTSGVLGDKFSIDMEWGNSWEELSVVTAGEKQGRELGRHKQIPVGSSTEESCGSCLTRAKPRFHSGSWGVQRWDGHSRGSKKNWAQMEEWACSEGGCWAEMPDLDGHKVHHPETERETIPFGITPLWFIHLRCV